MIQICSLNILWANVRKPKRETKPKKKTKLFMLTRAYITVAKNKTVKFIILVKSKTKFTMMKLTKKRQQQQQ